ncbi:MAG: hypothetical protein KAQ81_11155 [Deltaproteobacteria bacterium]|nr:hypothetical protein [Deltaproteobacteria bacterium]
MAIVTMIAGRRAPAIIAPIPLRRLGRQTAELSVRKAAKFRSKVKDYEAMSEKARKIYAVPALKHALFFSRVILKIN